MFLPLHCLGRNREEWGLLLEGGCPAAWPVVTAVFLSSPSSPCSSCHFLFLPTHGVDYKGFLCSVTFFGSVACDYSPLPPGFLVELLSSNLRKVLYLLKIKFERKGKRIQIPPISSGSCSQRFCSICLFPSKPGSAPFPWFSPGDRLNSSPASVEVSENTKPLRSSGKQSMPCQPGLLSGVINPGGQEESLHLSARELFLCGSERTWVFRDPH